MQILIAIFPGNLKVFVFNYCCDVTTDMAAGAVFHILSIAAL